MTVASIFLSALGLYLACGTAFAIPFALVGVKRIDPHAMDGSWGFRILILPGTVLLWPLLAKRWLRGTTHPPEEHSAHRCAARQSRISDFRSHSP